MSKNINDLQDLAIHAITKTVPADFAEASVADVTESFRQEMKELAGDYKKYRRNKNDVFEIIEVALDYIIPKRVAQIFGQFADIRFFKVNDKPSFKVKTGYTRAKRFVTKAAASGVYETFRLDSKDIEMTMSAVGGAGLIDFERFLGGDEEIADYANALLEGIMDSVFNEVQGALKASISAAGRPTANYYSGSAYVKSEMVKLINTAKAYGNGAVIFASPEFVESMGPDEIVSASTAYQPIVPTDDIEKIHNTGYIGVFRGCPVVVLPQSFTDESNSAKVIDPQYAYIFPTGGEKVVKLGFEGETVVKDWDNRDNSMELQAYKKFGVAITSYHNWCTYRNTSLA